MAHDLTRLVKDNMDLRKQRDELLAALKVLVDCISETRGKNADDALHNALAAIAKCES